jgi:hypothetical protein
MHISVSVISSTSGTTATKLIDKLCDGKGEYPEEDMKKCIMVNFSAAG